MHPLTLVLQSSIIKLVDVAGSIALFQKYRNFIESLDPEISVLQTITIIILGIGSINGLNNCHDRDQILSLKTKLVAFRSKIISFCNVNLPHEILVYPPKIYFPTLIIVTVGPLPSHRE